MRHEGSGVHPAIVELMRLLPPPGTVWPRERQLVFIQALDAIIANVYGGDTHMIWIGDDGDIKIAQRPYEPCKHGLRPSECGMCDDERRAQDSSNAAGESK